MARFDQPVPVRGKKRDLLARASSSRERPLSFHPPSPDSEKSLQCHLLVGGNEISDRELPPLQDDKGKPKNSVCLQTFTAGVQNRKGEILSLRYLCDGGSTRIFIKRETADLLGLKVICREELLIYAFGNRIRKRQIYDVVQLSLRNRKDPSRKIQISAVVIGDITVGEIEVPSERVRNIAFERRIELADTSDSEEVHVLIGSDFLWEVLKDTNVRLSRRLVATDSIFGFVVQGSERESNCGEVHVNLLRVINEELKYDRVKDLSELEEIGLNPKRKYPIRI
ncbi:hypothetical protein AVEN_232640-1 [Araneus ventricosus]|uniref:Uncharacterized protein n=1 Tax=Araneus ventricosus TaxID=182803 RepID=A0A4Y2SE11_ARAVE|nr:hypothetical protein AVEN_232640-1 [Araneus ventricosus]